MMGCSRLSSASYGRLFAGLVVLLVVHLVFVSMVVCNCMTHAACRAVSVGMPDIVLFLVVLHRAEACMLCFAVIVVL